MESLRNEIRSLADEILNAPAIVVGDLTHDGQLIGSAAREDASWALSILQHETSVADLEEQLRTLRGWASATSAFDQWQRNQAMTGDAEPEMLAASLYGRLEEQNAEMLLVCSQLEDESVARSALSQFSASQAAVIEERFKRHHGTGEGRVNVLRGMLRLAESKMTPVVDHRAQLWEEVMSGNGVTQLSATENIGDQVEREALRRWREQADVFLALISRSERELESAQRLLSAREQTFSSTDALQELLDEDDPIKYEEF
jgi:hypothetical protein